MKRTNFTAELISDQSRPGVVSILDRVTSAGTSPQEVVDACLDVMGPLEIDEQSRQELIEHAESLGPLDHSNGHDDEESAVVISEILQLIVSLREYQFA